MNLGDFREDYRRGALDRAGLEANPIAQFESWFRDATGEQSQSRWRKIGIALYKLWSALCNHRPADINAMTLATVDKSGKSSARTVLLKTVDERGFIFFTNYASRKGRELAENPNASLVFYWQQLERQVCVAGLVKKISRVESEKYFKSRPRDSRLAAWASNQSDVVKDRTALEAKWNEMSAKFPGEEIPLPPNWGGYGLKPERIEFWQGRPGRLHDRFQYTRQKNNSWKLERLAP
jgi:pyridoxamine 5'-phosphate oxidase